MARPTRARVRLVGGVTAAILLVTACGGRTPAPPEPDDPVGAADRLVAALSAGDVRGIPATADMQTELNEILAGMDGIRPTVTHGEVRRTGNAAEVPLTYVWPFAAARWEYTSTGTLMWSGTEWRVDWLAGMIHPELTSQTRLVHTSRAADRGKILNGAGAKLTDDVVVIRFGLDKSLLGEDEWEGAARRIAEKFGVNADRFAARVQAYGPLAFVEAIALRHDAEHPDGWETLPGVAGLTSTRSLPVDRDFAPELLGTVGPATAEQAQAAGPPVLAGDPIGISGLQRRQDPVLRGKSGAVVQLAPRRTRPAAEPADPSASPTASATTAPSTTSAATPIPRKLLFEATALPGQDLRTTLDSALQLNAERTLADVTGSAALVAVRPSDGAILAAAVSPGSGVDPHATFGHFPPGSTFKPVTALALMRAGLTADSLVECAPSVTVGGRTFTNYSGYPASGQGRITLREAIARSCNTALIAEHARITPADLQRAAASLGLGQDYEAGFSSFFATVPEPDPANPTVGFAENLIGQGRIEASPMAMAGVAASVSAGRTVVPRLLEGYAPPDPATPLSSAEAAALRSMMAATVTSGTADDLRGLLQGAKTGTAEFGTDTPPRTHAWLIVYADDLAVAVWVHDGTSGSGTAAPLMRAFLTGR
ncbi:MAG: penicillin-binding transpeptidase domain-containing protein [Propionibacteriaceae bacterium]|nr:penicillin-binding transpeptidase domain-containing protein [Propionibacteriaceae bacterium]